MPIAKITGQGLLAVACSVALLWACLAVEHITVRNAQLQRVHVLREIEQLRRIPRPTPAGDPQPAPAHRRTVTVG